MELLNLFFGSKQHKNFVPTEMDNVVMYVKGIVVRDDLIQGITQRYDQTKNLDAEQKNIVCTQTYLALEQFISENKPLVVQRTIPKEELRQEIRSKFVITSLPESFRVLFLPEKEQLLYLFERYTQSLALFIVNQTGPNKVSQIVAVVLEEQGIVGPRITNEGLDFSGMHSNLERIEIAVLKKYFTHLASALFKEIENSFGTKSAIDVTEKVYAKIKEEYDYDLVSKYLIIAPQGILDKDRIAYMTRGELEKQAQGIVEERVRRELAEKATRDLQKAVEERTQELNAEKEELKKNDAKLLASIGGLPVGLILTNTTDGIVAINKAAKEILAIKIHFTYISEIDLMTKEMDFKTSIEACKKEKKPKSFKEIAYANKILDVTFTPIFISDSHDIYIGTVILINDVTEATLLERSKDEFFAIASHELRTPLTAIRGYLSLIETYYGKEVTNPDVQRMLSRIDASSKRLIDIVNEFLDMSRLEQGRIEFKSTSLNVSELIKEIFNEIGALAEKKQIFLRFENPDNTFHNVYADRDKLKQILANLIGNAIKFTETGGVSMHIEESEGNMYLHVKDSGKGISPENQNFLFKKFQQAGSSPYTKDAQSGSGLGLYISRKLAQNMNGDVYLESSIVNTGTTFGIRIPIDKRQLE